MSLRAPDPGTRQIRALPPELAGLHRELGVPAGYVLDRQLEVQSEAPESVLVEVGQNPAGRPVLLLQPVAESWHRLKLAAATDGTTLVPISGFRSVHRQAEIFRDKLKRGQTPAEILRVTAVPGFSEHHTGRAIDIGTPGYLALEEDFGSTEAFRWLERNAAAFGFRLSYPRDNPHGIAYEPWHWCWHQ